MYNSTMSLPPNYTDFTTVARQIFHTSPYESNNNSYGNSNSDSANDDRHHELDHMIIDERKQRRMISNRESARRSRMRKRKHLDELWSHVVKLRDENRNLLDELNRVSERCEIVFKENEKIKDENCDLRQVLSTLQMCSVASPYNALRNFDDEVTFCEIVDRRGDDSSCQSSVDLFR